MVVVRGHDGALRAFVNVCRHRGHLVAEGCGRRETLQCPYHAWTYGLDGSLRAAPRSEREPGFDLGDWALHRVRVETWGPLVFVNPTPTRRRSPIRSGAFRHRWPRAGSIRRHSSFEVAAATG